MLLLFKAFLVFNPKFQGANVKTLSDIRNELRMTHIADSCISAVIENCLSLWKQISSEESTADYVWFVIASVTR